MQIDELLLVVQEKLDDKKALNIKAINVQGKTTVTDYMVIATGTSARHVMSLAEYVVEDVKEKGLMPLGVEGEVGSEWVLVDLGDIILHLMTVHSREFYQLEKLWEPEFSDKAGQIG